MPSGSGDSSPSKRPAGSDGPTSKPPRSGAAGEFQARMKFGTGELTPGPRQPTDTAGRAKMAAAESSAWVKDEAALLLTNYKTSTKYFKWKFWIIAAYLVVSVGSVMIAFWPTNPIEAYAKITTDPGDSSKLLIFVRNDSSSKWQHVKLIVNDVWVAEKEKLDPQGDVTFNLSQFRRAGTTEPGGGPKGAFSVHSLKITCDRGSYYQSVP